MDKSPVTPSHGDARVLRGEQGSATKNLAPLPIKDEARVPPVCRPIPLEFSETKHPLSFKKGERDYVHKQYKREREYEMEMRRVKVQAEGENSYVANVAGYNLAYAERKVKQLAQDLSDIQHDIEAFCDWQRMFPNESSDSTETN